MATSDVVDGRVNTACAIAGDGLYCWGNNHHGNITTRPPSDAAEQAIMQALRAPL